MAKPSPTLLGLAVAAVVSVCGCAGGLLPNSGESAGRLTQQAPEPTFPNAAHPNYEQTYAQHREQMTNRQVVSPALGIQRKGDSGTVHQVGLGSGVSSMAKSVSSGVQQGVAKVGKMLTPKERVNKATEPTSVFNPSEPSPDLHVAMARLHEQSGKLDQAEQQYGLALKLAPDHLGALVGYAHLEDRLGHLDQAIGLYQQAAGAHPHEPSVFNDMGLCYARNGKLGEAVAALDHAVQLHPKKPLYRNNIAIVLTEVGQTDSALAHLRAVQGEAVARYNLGQLLLRKGQREAAAEQFALALRSDPSLTQAKDWLNELARSGVTPGQTASRIASRPPERGPEQTIHRPPTAPREPPTARRRPSDPTLRGTESPPRPQGRPTSGGPPARDLRSVYGNFPVPPGRRLRAPRAPEAPPASRDTVPGRAPRTPLPAPHEGSEGERAQLRAPAAVPKPPAPPSYLDPPLSVAPEPSGAPDRPPRPSMPGKDGSDLLAPLPPVTDSGTQIEPVEALPPVESAPLPR